MIYLDTSALLKLVFHEAGSDAIAAVLADRTDLLSSALLAIEARRAVLRGASGALSRVDALLTRITMIEISSAVVESAGRLPDPVLRSPEAIHLATALLVRDEVDVLLTYADRLLLAARDRGLNAEAPALPLTRPDPG